jgi:hypothetical protein
MTPSQVCFDPEYLKDDVYEVLLKSLSHRFKSQEDSNTDVTEAVSGAGQN